MTAGLAPRRLCADEKGATAVEFGFVAPIMLLMLLGFFDVGHSLFMRAMIEGEIQRAARNSTLETGGLQANRDAVDTEVRKQILALNRHATITIDRRAYSSFSNVEQPEPWVDADGNGACNGETYTDRNNNNSHDIRGGTAGQGGAKDTVLFSVVVSYKRLFPLKIVGLSDTSTFKAETVMNNQPYGEQNVTVSATNRVCPP